MERGNVLLMVWPGSRQQRNGVEPANSKSPSNLVSSELPDEDGQLPGVSLSYQWTPPDDRESSSRSTSPSADESEQNASISCDRDCSMIPPASSSPPLSPSP